MKKFLLLVLLAGAWLSATQTASAHAVVFMCAPRIGTKLAKPPSQIVCIFDGSLANSTVTLSVLGPKGERVDKNDAHPFEGDAYSYAISLDPNKMGDGIYQLNWYVLDKTDNTETSGAVQFGVNTVVPPTPTVLLPGQVLVTPSVAQPNAPTNATGELVSRFLIASGVILFAAMGVLLWRMRASGKHEQ